MDDDDKKWFPFVNFKRKMVERNSEFPHKRKCILIWGKARCTKLNSIIFKKATTFSSQFSCVSASLRNGVLLSKLPFGPAESSLRRGWCVRVSAGAALAGWLRALKNQQKALNVDEKPAAEGLKLAVYLSLRAETSDQWKLSVFKTFDNEASSLKICTKLIVKCWKNCLWSFFYSCPASASSNPELCVKPTKTWKHEPRRNRASAGIRIIELMRITK